MKPIHGKPSKSAARQRTARSTQRVNHHQSRLISSSNNNRTKLHQNTSHSSHTRTFKTTKTLRFSSQTAPVIEDPNQPNSEHCCWKCPKADIRNKELFCQSCGVLQRPEFPIASQNFFQLFDLPESFDIDEAKLELTFRKLQQKIHPDLYISKEDKEYDFSVEYSSQINRGFDILKTPMLRAKYIISLHAPELLQMDENFSDFCHPCVSSDGEVTAPSPTCQSASSSCKVKSCHYRDNRPKQRISMTQLMEIMEKREDIAEHIGQPTKLMNIFQTNLESIQDIYKSISHAIQQGDYNQALTDVEYLGYFDSMQRELQQIIPSEIFNNANNNNNNNNNTSI